MYIFILPYGRLREPASRFKNVLNCANVSDKVVTPKQQELERSFVRSEKTKTEILRSANFLSIIC